MLINRLFLLTIIAFYISNIYLSQINSFLIMWKWAFILCLLFFILATNLKRDFQQYFIPDHLHFAFGIILFYGIFSTYLNTSDYTGLSKFFGLFLVIFLAYKMSNFFMFNENSEAFYKTLMVVASLVVVSSIIFFLLGLNLGRVSADGGRFSGWVDNPNTLGMMLLPVYPVVFIYALNNKKLGLINPRILLLLLLIVVVFSGARSVAAAIGVASIIILNYQKGGKERLVLLSIVSIAVILLIGYELKDMIINTVYYKRGDNLLLSGREEVWAVAFMLIQQQPYFGYGFDTEGALITQYHHLLLTHQGKVFHNSYLSYLVHLGFIGVLPLIWILIYSVRSLLYLRYYSNTPEEMKMKLISAAIVFSSLVHAMFETWLFSPGNLATLLFWIAIFNLNCRLQVINR